MMVAVSDVFFSSQLSKGLCDNGKSKVVDILLDMRKQRMGLIQTHDQLRFSYQAIVYGAHKLTEMNGKVGNRFLNAFLVNELSSKT